MHVKLTEVDKNSVGEFKECSEDTQKVNKVDGRSRSERKVDAQSLDQMES